jgi:excisionase family DNA binding protein
VTDVTLLTVAEAGERLRVTERHVYRLIADGALRTVDVARPGARKSKTRVRTDDLAAYINAQSSTDSTVSVRFGHREPQPTT